MSIIEIEHLTKDYGGGKGVFDVSLHIEKGEIYGYLGPNGAGKSTTLRHLMGFIKPDSGTVKVNGFDAWTQQKMIQQNLGYLPGEISLPDDMTGTAFISMIAKMRGMKNLAHAKELQNMFNINPDMGMKRMSKGMKQKIAIITAFMHEPEIILLDEPTSGLDPLMQNTFVELVASEKQKGTTVIMSSHMFEEVEKTCGRIGIIKNGKIIQETDVDSLVQDRRKTYQIKFVDSADIARVKSIFPDAQFDIKTQTMELSISNESINELISILSDYKICSLTEVKHSLEEYFMQFYGGEQIV